MSTLVTIALITLMLTAWTVFISFCIYSQSRSNHVWLAERTGGGDRLSQSSLAFGHCDEHCQLEQCKLLNANGHFALGLSYIAKVNRHHGATVDLLLCAADSYLGLKDFDSALEHYLRTRELATQPNEEVLTKLALIYTNALHQPNNTMALLEPYLLTSEATPAEGSAGHNASLSLRASAELNCAYVQALAQSPEHSQLMLQYLEVLRVDKVPFDACIMYAQHQVLISHRYFADAYQYGAEFVRKYPALHEAHTTMGEALLALQRTAEAAVVLKVAHSLVAADELRASLSSPLANRNTTLDSLLRLGDALHACEAHKEAESVFALAVGLLRPDELAQQCPTLSRASQVYLEMNHYYKAYVASLQCVKCCPTFAEGYLQLGKAQHQLGLLHDALASLKVAARSRAHKVEAKALTKAVKATDAANLEKQAKADEAKLGPQAPLDPSIKRQQTNELFIDMLARKEKEKEEKDAREKAAAQAPAVGQPKTDVNSDKFAPSETAGDAANGRADEVSAGLQVNTKAEVEVGVSGPGAPVVAPVSASTATDPHAAPQPSITTGVSAPDAPVSVPAELSATEADARRRANGQIVQALAFLNRPEPNFPQVLAALKGAIKKAPLYPEPYMLRGDLYLQQGEYLQASEDFLKIFTELNIHNATCATRLHDIIVKLIALGHVEKASAINSQLGEWAPKDERSCTDLASAYLKQKEYNLALVAMYRIDPSLPATTERVKFIAHIHELSGSQVRASETLYVGIYKNLTTYVDLGDMYFRSGNKTMGILAFNSALAGETDPTELGSLHLRLAKTHLELHDEALAAAEEDARDALEEQGLDRDSAVVGVLEVDPEQLNKAYFHFAEAKKLGVSNYDTRKFFARFPQFAPVEVSAEHSVVANEMTEPAKAHHLPRWMSRHTAAEVSQSKLEPREPETVSKEAPPSAITQEHE